jgi:hypothetical protein
VNVRIMTYFLSNLYRDVKISYSKRKIDKRTVTGDNGERCQQGWAVRFF